MIRHVDWSPAFVIPFECRQTCAPGGSFIADGVTVLVLMGQLKLLIVFETFEDEAAAVRSFARPK